MTRLTNLGVNDLALKNYLCMRENLSELLYNQTAIVLTIQRLNYYNQKMRLDLI